MMIKNFYDLLQIILKQKAKQHIKRQKSKLLIYDIYLKKYVNAAKLLLPSPAKESVQVVESWKTSKDFVLFDLLMKKFINPKLDLLSPPGVNIKQNIWHCNTVQGCRYASTLKEFWERGVRTNTDNVAALPSPSQPGDSLGWAGQVLNKPESNPRPEQRTTNAAIEQDDNPEKNSRTARKNGREKEKNNKYDRNSIRNGSLLYVGKAEKKKKSLLTKSFKIKQDVILQKKSKSELWAKKSNLKYNIFKKSYGALSKTKLKNNLSVENKKVLINVKEPKKEKGALFTKIYSQMLSFRKPGGDLEETFQKGSNNDEKEDCINKASKSFSKESNAEDNKSIVKNCPMDGKLANKIAAPGIPKSESKLENITTHVKLSKSVKEDYKETQRMTNSQNEIINVKNNISERNISEKIEDSHKTNSWFDSIIITSLATKSTSTNQLAKNITKHHKVKQNSSKLQNKNYHIAKNKNVLNQLDKKERTAVENNKSETTLEQNNGESHVETRSSQNENLISFKTTSERGPEDVQKHYQVTDTILDSKNKIDFNKKAPGNEMAKIVENYLKGSNSLSFSIPECPDPRNMTYENELREETKGRYDNLTSLKSKAHVAENNNVNYNEKENKKVTQSLKTSQNINLTNPQPHSSYKSEMFDVNNQGKDLGDNVQEPHEKTHILSSFEYEKASNENNTSGNNSLGESDEVRQSLTDLENSKAISKNSEECKRYTKPTETKICSEDDVSFQNDQTSNKLLDETLNVVDASKNKQTDPNETNITNKTHTTIKNDEFESNTTYLEVNKDETIMESYNEVNKNKLKLKNNSMGEYVINDSSSLSQEQLKATKVKSLKYMIFNFLSPPTLSKSMKTVQKSNHDISTRVKCDNRTPDQTTKLSRIDETKLSYNITSNSNLNASDKVCSLTKSHKLSNRGSLTNNNNAEKVKLSANLQQQLKDLSLNTSRDQKKTHTTTSQIVQSIHVRNTLKSSSEKPADNTGISSGSLKKLITKIDDDKSEVNTLRDYNIEPKYTEKLHTISAQGKHIEDLALEGDLIQYNIDNYKGFKIMNCNSDPQVKRNNLSKQTTPLKMGINSGPTPLNYKDTTFTKPTALQKFHKYHNTNFHKPEKRTKIKSTSEKLNDSEGIVKVEISEQSKNEDKTSVKQTLLKPLTELQGPTVLQNPSKLQNPTELKTVSPEDKKQVTNYEEITHNQTLDTKMKIIKEIKEIKEKKSLKKPEEHENIIPSNENITPKSLEGTNEVNQHTLPNKKTNVEFGEKRNEISQQDESHISTPNANAGDNSSKEPHTLLNSKDMTISNFAKENKLDQRKKHRNNNKKLIKQTLFQFSKKKLRKLKAAKAPQELRITKHLKEKKNISTKQQNERSNVQRKSSKKISGLKKTPKIDTKLQVLNKERSKSVHIFQEERPVPVIKQKKITEKIKSKSGTLLTLNNINPQKQAKSLSKGVKVHNSNKTDYLTEVNYSLKENKKNVKKQRSIEKLNLNARDNLKKGKLSSNKSLPSVNQPQLGKIQKISTSQTGIHFLKTNKMSRVDLSEKTHVTKASSKVVGAISTPALQYKSQGNKSRRGKLLVTKTDVKRTKVLNISKPGHNSKANNSIEKQNNRTSRNTGRTQSALRRKLESAISPENTKSLQASKDPAEFFDRNHVKKGNVQVISEVKLSNNDPEQTQRPKSQNNGRKKYSSLNQVNNKYSMNVAKKEVIPFGSKENINSKTAVNTMKSHAFENKSREKSKLAEIKITTKPSLISTVQKRRNHNIKLIKTKKTVSLNKLHSRENIESITTKKDAASVNNSQEAETPAFKELPKKNLNETYFKSGKQENKSKSTEPIITQRVPVLKESASPGESKNKVSNNLNSKGLKIINKNESLSEDIDVNINLKSTFSFNDRKSNLSKITNNINKKSNELEKNAKKYVKNQENSLKIETQMQIDNIANNNSNRQDRAGSTSQELSDKLGNNNVVSNANQFRTNKIHAGEQMIDGTKKSERIQENSQKTLHQIPNNKAKELHKEDKMAVLHSSKEVNNIAVSKYKNKRKVESNKNQTIISLEANLGVKNQTLTNNEEQSNKEKAHEFIKKTEPYKKTTDKAKRVSNTERKTPKEPNSQVNIPSTPKSGTPNSENLISSKKLHSKKLINIINTSSDKINESYNIKTPIKVENNLRENGDKNISRGKKGNVINSNTNENNKKMVTSSESKITPFKPNEKHKKGKDIMSPLKTQSSKSNEQRNALISNRSTHKENLSVNNTAEIQPLKNLSSNKTFHTTKDLTLENINNKLSSMQDEKRETYTPNYINKETISLTVKTPKNRGTLESYNRNRKSYPNLKEQQIVDKDLLNNNKKVVSILQEEIKHNQSASLKREKIAKKSSEETVISKQRDLEKPDQFLEHMVKVKSNEKDTTQDTINTVEIEEKKENLSAGTEETVAIKKDVSKIDGFYFQTEDLTLEKLRLMSGNIETRKNIQIKDSNRDDNFNNENKSNEQIKKVIDSTQIHETKNSLIKHDALLLKKKKVIEPILQGKRDKLELKIKEKRTEGKTSKGDSLNFNNKLVDKAQPMDAMKPPAAPKEIKRKGVGSFKNSKTED